MIVTAAKRMKLGATMVGSDSVRRLDFIQFPLTDPTHAGAVPRRGHNDGGGACWD
jgi:hypothetical protein